MGLPFFRPSCLPIQRFINYRNVICIKRPRNLPFINLCININHFMG